MLFVPIAIMAPEAQAGCGVAVSVLGLHGVGEGPGYANDTKDRWSPEIEDTFKAFLQDNATGKNVVNVWVSGPTVGNGYVLYPTVSVNPSLLWKIWGNVQAGTNALNSAYERIEGIQCGYSLRVELVGYSEGAWIINNWLWSHPSDWSHIKAVLLLGDPCLYYPLAAHQRRGASPLDAYQGLARYLPLNGRGCGPAAEYAPHAPFAGDHVMSLCYTGDPLCGWGFEGPRSGGLPPASQDKAAISCIFLKSSCTHYDYITGDDGAIETGARFLAANAS